MRRGRGRGEKEGEEKRRERRGKQRKRETEERNWSEGKKRDGGRSKEKREQDGTKKEIN